MGSRPNVDVYVTVLRILSMLWYPPGNSKRMNPSVSAQCSKNRKDTGTHGNIVSRVHMRLFEFLGHQDKPFFFVVH
jgi:hypothetical protein